MESWCLDQNSQFETIYLIIYLVPTPCSPNEFMWISMPLVKNCLPFSDQSSNQKIDPAGEPESRAL